MMSAFIKKPKNGQTVAVLGVGISGLMDAFALSRAGFTVSIYTKGPDPRKNLDMGQYSSTRGGGLGRFISRFEGEHYLGDSPMYPDMKGAFQKHVEDGGWLGKHKHEFTDFDKIWLKKRLGACDDERSINQTEQFYVQANGKAMDLWQEMILQFPELFQNVDLLNTGILRLYDTITLFNWAVHRHKREGVLERGLSAEDVAKSYPYFSEAVERGYIRGGLEAPGFSFNIHAFTDNIINYLEGKGVRFFWNQTISSIKFSPDGLVEGLVSENGLVTAKHYSLNPGAYADEGLLEGTPAAGKIAGVAGRWMFMPSPENFKRPIKIHGDRRLENGKNFPVVDLNLTHFRANDGKEWLAIGGGYVYLGKLPFDPENSAFNIIDSENERTVKRYLGPTYEQANKSGFVRKSEATCLRSFTYDDMPIMDNMRTVNNGILRINAGTNTGTTTISPFTAGETVKALS